MKSIWKSLMVGLILVTCLTSTVFAAETEYDMSAAGDGSVIATFEDTTGVLTISGSGTMKNFSNSNSPIRSILGSVKELIIEDGVQNIGDYAFGDNYTYGRKSLTGLTNGSIVIPNSVTSIGKYAFYYGYSITSIEIPNSVTSIGDYAFYECSKLSSAKLSSSLGSIGAYTFYNCTTLPSIQIPDSVTAIGNDAFNGCAKLTSVEMPSSLTSIGANAFYNCKVLSSIEIPDGVTSIGDKAFYNCYKLASIEMPGVTSIGNSAFYYCEGLTSITIGENCTNIGDNAFIGTENVSEFICLSPEITLGVTLFGDSHNYMGLSVSTKTATVHANQVYMKDSLEALGFTVNTIGEKTSSGGESYPSANIYELGTPTSTDVIGYYNEYSKVFKIEGLGQMKDVSSTYGYLGGKAVDEIIIGEGITSIGKRAFRTASAKSVSLPSTLTSIGNDAFYTCSGLTSITIPANVETIGATAFQNASNLESITFESGSKLKTIENRTFHGCDLRSVVLPDSLETVDYQAFGANNNLSYIVIPESVKTIGEEAFFRYGEGSEGGVVYNYGDETQTIGKKAFYQNTSAKAPTIYQYQGNTAMTAALAESAAAPASVVYLDGVVELTGTLDNGIVWTYDPDTKTLTFTGDGEIPDFEDGYQPWYAAASQNGGVGTYMFGNGITGIGSGVFGSYGSGGYGGNGSGSTIYGPSGLDYAGAGGGGASYGGSYSDGTGGGSGSGGSSGSGDGSDTGDNENTGSSENTMIIVDAEPTNFLVTVPIRIDVEMDAEGNISTGDGYYVENECAMGPILITDIEVVEETEWSLVAWDSDFHNMKASSKVIALTINGVEVNADGSVVMNDSLSSVIRNKESKELFFDAKLPAQKSALQANAAAVVFTVDFDKV